MKRCRHANLVLLRLHEAVARFWIEDGVVTDDLDSPAYPTNRWEVTCSDCDVKRFVVASSGKLPAWIRRAIEVIEEHQGARP